MAATIIRLLGRLEVVTDRMTKLGRRRVPNISVWTVRLLPCRYPILRAQWTFLVLRDRVACWVLTVVLTGWSTTPVSTTVAVLTVVVVLTLELYNALIVVDVYSAVVAPSLDMDIFRPRTMFVLRKLTLDVIRVVMCAGLLALVVSAQMLIAANR